MKAEIKKGSKKDKPTIYSGIFSDRSGKKFDFTINEKYDLKNKNTSFEITFCNEEPNDIMKAVEIIAKEFNSISD